MRLKSLLSCTLLSSALIVGGCVNVGMRRAPAAPTRASNPADDRDAAAALLLANTLQTLQRLAQGQPAEQAEILSEARQAYERAPLGAAQLRYALVEALPGPSARDPALAQRLLRELAAAPEGLTPAERALTLLELAQLDRELGLAADNSRLQGEAQRSDRERLASAQRRLQMELDENTKLRKQLDDAQAKLDAIANIERHITERQSGTESRKP